MRNIIKGEMKSIEINNYDEIKEIISKQGLKPGLKRDCSLFTSSAAAIGYTKFLNEIIGAKYNAYGAISFNGDYYSIVNVDFVASEIENALKREDITLALARAYKIYENSLKIIEKISKTNNPEENIKKILEMHGKYFGSLGLYNALYRYFGDNEERIKKYSDYIDKIGKERNEVASLYPKVDKLIKEYSEEIGKKEGFTDNLLYLTLNEMKEFTINGLTKELKDKTEQRKKQYFHLYITEMDSEIVISDPKLVKKIKQDFYERDTLDSSILSGKSAYPGKVKGRVKVINSISEISKVTNGDILVAFHTHPQFIEGVKKAVAIVTDEGGILSHAAIIARELNKPCIIGTKIATKVLKDGMLVEVDAKKGIVKIIEKK